MEHDWQAFREGLLAWYRPDRRPMPWKENTDPYRIWLSEIILQQTRVEQGWPYFERFVAAYPTVGELAAAPDDAVMKLWEGLGYYSRARNLLRAARTVTAEHDGRFPDTYAGLLALPGIGPYTAAAIASFAFDRQVAVLDGNVFRVLARYAGDATPTTTGPGRKHFQQLAERALGDTPAARFNQAIMDFGALVCTPKLADCAHCPLATSCRALAEEKVYALPLKKRKTAVRTRYFHYLVIKDEQERYLLEQRPAGDIWQSLYQFPLVEAERIDLSLPRLTAHPNWPADLAPDPLRHMRRSGVYRHQLSHQTIGAVFHVLSVGDLTAPAYPPSGMLVVPRAEFERYALPRIITRFLEDTSLTLGF
ncbi:Adenine DNA glycosylase [Neolewinella maritima]|uniref:Adenine DNA glycosylase n=1 Tax=Neolewinella maritima TaxID=1383882 RepID=A0ABN8F1M1_9BACT|nr:A/G-specific adenine glycosylase [Neolewinella maritima]CAH1000656.1 Adenine DNA glycosylase [Neolewinella maritima]